MDPTPDSSFKSPRTGICHKSATPVPHSLQNRHAQSRVRVEVSIDEISSRARLPPPDCGHLQATSWHVHRNEHQSGGKNTRPPRTRDSATQQPYSGSCFTLRSCFNTATIVTVPEGGMPCRPIIVSGALRVDFQSCQSTSFFKHW